MVAISPDLSTWAIRCIDINCYHSDCSPEWQVTGSILMDVCAEQNWQRMTNSEECMLNRVENGEMERQR